MKSMKRWLSLLFALLLMVQVMAGCSNADDDENYLTKGEFFSYFVYENALTSEQYTADDINDCEDGSVQADIIVEWGYLSADLAKKKLDKPVEKEIVVMVCANATFDLKKGDTEIIKDSKKLSDPQLIADAYASGFFELDNGKFDGKEKMTVESCEEILNKAREYTADFHYEANTEVTKTAEGVKEQKTDNYSDEDIIVEFFEDEPVGDVDLLRSEAGEKVLADTMQTNVSDSQKTTLSVTTLEVNHFDSEMTPLFGDGEESVGANGFVATIMKGTFEKDLGNPEIGDTVILKRFQMMMTDQRLGYGDSEIIGVLVEKQFVGASYVCEFEFPSFESAVEKKNVETANESGIDVESFTVEESEVAGWKLAFNVTNDSVKISAKKDFTVHETGRKQDWQNAKKTMTATADFEIGDFNLDINNLQSFAGEKGKGYIKITCDTDMDFSMSQSLRYTPDSNRNGKFPSNWNNSRWTDADSKGATTIKVAKFTPSFYGVVGVDVYIYLQISMDGKVSFISSIDNGGVQLVANNGKIGLLKLGKKEDEVDAKVNVYGRLGVDATLKIFGFINVIQYDVGANVDIHAASNLYYEEKLCKSGVYADEEGLQEYAEDDGEFGYCIEILAEFYLLGELKDSGVKRILEIVSKEESLDFEFPLLKTGFHIEDGKMVAKCRRTSEGEKLEENETKAEQETEKYRLTPVLENTVEADTIRYYDAATGYDFAVIEKDDKFGLIDYNGRIILPIEYDSIELMQPSPSVKEAKLFAVDENHTYFMIEKDGSLTETFPGGWGYERNMEVYWMNGKPLLLDSWEGMIDFTYEGYTDFLFHGAYSLGTYTFASADVIPIQEISGYTEDNEGMGYWADVTLVSEKYALFNIKTKELITDFIFDSYGFNGFIEGVLPVKKGGKWGYVDEEGNMLTDFIYDASEEYDSSYYVPPYGKMYSAQNGYIIVRSGDLWGLIDTKGETVTEVKYQDISQVNDEGDVWIKENDQWSLYRIGQ